jgi:hypothetical protein
LIPKPEITIRYIDLKFQATKKHFNQLSSRYGCPIVAVSLLGKRPQSSECFLANEYVTAIDYIDDSSTTLYEFDLKNAAVSEAGTMYKDALELARGLIQKTCWNSWKQNSPLSKQRGVIRTNCIDCLDRTNIFQYIVGLEVLSQQLIELGVLVKELKPTWSNRQFPPVIGTGGTRSPSIDFDAAMTPCTSISSLVPLIEEIFESAGDQLSYQYAGTAAHKKYAAGDQQSQKRGILTAGKEIFISLSRHYSSSFTDNDKQNAYNLFLGMYEDVMKEVHCYDDVCMIEGVDRWVHLKKPYDLVETRDEDISVSVNKVESEISLQVIQDLSGEYQSLNPSRLNNVRHIHFSE